MVNKDVGHEIFHNNEEGFVLILFYLFLFLLFLFFSKCINYKLFLIYLTGEIPELKEELNNPDKKRKIVAMKKVIANMTMGNDMSSLFPDALACMQTPALELKKMVYLYVVTYAKTKPELALLCVNSFIRV